MLTRTEQPPRAHDDKRRLPRRLLTVASRRKAAQAPQAAAARSRGRGARQRSPARWRQLAPRHRLRACSPRRPWPPPPPPTTWWACAGRSSATARRSTCWAIGARGAARRAASRLAKQLGRRPRLRALGARPGPLADAPRGRYTPVNRGSGETLERKRRTPLMIAASHGRRVDTRTASALLRGAPAPRLRANGAPALRAALLPPPPRWRPAGCPRGCSTARGATL